MKKIRFNGDLPAFASEQSIDERTIFGSAVVSDDINSQITVAFKRGWGSSTNLEPRMQDFNALGFTHSELIGYLYQQGIPEYSSTATYYTSNMCAKDGVIYVSKTDGNIGNTLGNDTTHWYNFTIAKLDKTAVKQTVGTSVFDVMSQAGVKVALDTKLDKTAVKQVAGVSTTDVMSQKAVRDLFLIAMPTGAVMDFAGETAPTGWLERDGSAISRVTYSELFSVIGSMYGDGDGSTTFNLPDSRGLFNRHADGGAGVDPDAATRTNRGDGISGDAVGTKQDGEIQSHTHTETRVGSGPGSKNIDFGDNYVNTSTSTGATGGSETRPVNIAWLGIIKY